MAERRLFYATNRNHLGKDRWHPDGYGKKFSDDGVENLRFGRVLVKVDESKIDRSIEKDRGSMGQGDGDGLIKYLTKCAESADIVAYREKINRSVAEDQQDNVKLGSTAAFSDLQTIMRRSSDVLLFIHGYNVSWTNAVGTALSLQEMLSRCPDGDPEQQVQVVLFTWPSDGMALPFVSYKSDRSEAAGSGNAVGRGILSGTFSQACVARKKNSANRIFISSVTPWGTICWSTRSNDATPSRRAMRCRASSNISFSTQPTWTIRRWKRGNP